MIQAFRGLEHVPRRTSRAAYIPGLPGVVTSLPNENGPGISAELSGYVGSYRHLLDLASCGGSERAFDDIIISGPAKRVPLFLELGFA